MTPTAELRRLLEEAKAEGGRGKIEPWYPAFNAYVQAALIALPALLDRLERLQRSLHDRADDIDALGQEVSRLKIDEKVWRRSFVDLSERFRALEALHGSCPAPDTSVPAHTRE